MSTTENASSQRAGLGFDHVGITGLVAAIEATPWKISHRTCGRTAHACVERPGWDRAEVTADLEALLRAAFLKPSIRFARTSAEVSINLNTAVAVAWEILCDVKGRATRENLAGYVLDEVDHFLRTGRRSQVKMCSDATARSEALSGVHVGSSDVEGAAETADTDEMCVVPGSDAHFAEFAETAPVNMNAPADPAATAAVAEIMSANAKALDDARATFAAAGVSSEQLSATMGWMAWELTTTGVGSKDRLAAARAAGDEAAYAAAIAVTADSLARATRTKGNRVAEDLGMSTDKLGATIKILLGGTNKETGRPAVVYPGLFTAGADWKGLNHMKRAITKLRAA
ncbi:hypothetical protein KIV56_04520 [Cryobacterium breve]|uniref:DUF222 domain-containing protein n=1 Tax=Cryobacterium breve TaxID=1259258 RepID=A0ABY7NF97_9MICO|nr:hypothetical protein [Cryobacterium breve]WBM80667.1 hypothetical protein KIV56_04520 [Cryobacterium breve]